VIYLQERDRHVESIPFAAAIVEKEPGNVEYRVVLMRALGRAGDREKLVAALEAAEDWFREKKAMGEGAAAGLAGACVETGLFEKALSLYDEAIAIHLKAVRRRSGGDGQLSGYYQGKARAWSGLGKTKEAVDAASAGIVSWGPRQDQRMEATKVLLDILRAAKDLDAFATLVDAQAEKDKKENPTLRTALGKVWLERKEYAKAARHLDAAVESGPVDPEAYKALTEAYEKAGDPARAAARVLALARAKARDFALWKDLGERLAMLGRAAEADRAYATLAETSANESEGRQALAEVRESQKRFADAAEEWRQVIRVRSREPGGYLGLARSLIGAGRPQEAREPIDHLLGTQWPERNGVVRAEAGTLVE
jgi:tetratricopeptide (TPR) repeat protein